MTTTKERPIVLREWEVKAIQAGRLSLLVRPVEPQPLEGSTNPLVIPKPAYGGSGVVFRGPDGLDARPKEYQRPDLWECPLGQPGDVLVTPDGKRLVNAGVRVARVQEMSHRDVLHAGWPDHDKPAGGEKTDTHWDHVTKGDWIDATGDGDDACIEWFADQYDADHGPGSWDRNDWAWLVSVQPIGGDA